MGAVSAGGGDDDDEEEDARACRALARSCARLKARVASAVPCNARKLTV